MWTQVLAVAAVLFPTAAFLLHRQRRSTESAALPAPEPSSESPFAPLFRDTLFASSPTTNTIASYEQLRIELSQRLAQYWNAQPRTIACSVSFGTTGREPFAAAMALLEVLLERNSSQSPTLALLVEGGLHRLEAITIAEQFFARTPFVSPEETLIFRFARVLSYALEALEAGRVLLLLQHDHLCDPDSKEVFALLRKLHAQNAKKQQLAIIFLEEQKDSPEPQRSSVSPLDGLPPFVPEPGEPSYTPEEQALFAVAALLGVSFSVDELAEIMGETEEHTRARIRRSKQQQVLRSSDGTRWFFRTPSVRHPWKDLSVAPQSYERLLSLWWRRSLRKVRDAITRERLLSEEESRAVLSLLRTFLRREATLSEQQRTSWKTSLCWLHAQAGIGALSLHWNSAARWHLFQALSFEEEREPSSAALESGITNRSVRDALYNALIELLLATDAPHAVGVVASWLRELEGKANVDATLPLLCGARVFRRNGNRKDARLLTNEALRRVAADSMEEFAGMIEWCASIETEATQERSVARERLASAVKTNEERVRTMEGMRAQSLRKLLLEGYEVLLGLQEDWEAKSACFERRIELYQALEQPLKTAETLLAFARASLEEWKLSTDEGRTENEALLTGTTLLLERLQSMVEAQGSGWLFLQCITLQNEVHSLQEEKANDAGQQKQKQLEALLGCDGSKTQNRLA